MAPTEAVLTAGGDQDRIPQHILTSKGQAWLEERDDLGSEGAWCCLLSVCLKHIFRWQNHFPLKKILGLLTMLSFSEIYLNGIAVCSK